LKGLDFCKGHYKEDCQVSITNPTVMVPPPTGNAVEDRAAIQSAIDMVAVGNGGTVMLQRGVYVLEPHTRGSYTCCLFLYQGVRLIGAGWQATILYAGDSDCHIIMTDPALWNGSSYDCKTGIRLENLQVTAGPNSGPYTGIYLNGVACFFAQNVWVVGNLAGGYHLTRGFHIKGWVGSLYNCNVIDSYQGYNLSWEDDLGEEGPVDNTNAFTLVGCHFGGGTLTPPEAGSIGCYIRGFGNSLSGSTIERNFTETTPTETQVAVYIKNGAGTTLTGCHFEGWKANFTFDGCSGATITGGFMSSCYGVDAVAYLNGADSVINSNVLRNIYESVWQLVDGVLISVSTTVRYTDNVKTINTVATTPAIPTATDRGRVYIKGDNIIFQYKDGTDTRYKWLPLTGTSVTWQQSTVAP
jgi:hypothetical protein